MHLNRKREVRGQWLTKHILCQVSINGTFCLDYHQCKSAMVKTPTKEFQDVIYTTSDYSYFDMNNSLDTFGKLSSTAWTALRLLLILSGIEPNPGPFSKADKAESTSHDWTQKSVFLLNIDHEIETYIWNKNRPEARHICLMKLLDNIGSIGGCPTICIYVRRRKMFLLFISKILSKMDCRQTNETLPQSFLAYKNDSGKMQICHISPDLNSFLEPIYELVETGSVYCIDYSDLQPSVSLVQSNKFKVLNVTEDNSHLACFSSPVFSLQIYTNDKEDATNPIQINAEEEHNTVPVQVVDDADGLNSYVAPSSSQRDIPVLSSFQPQTNSHAQVSEDTEDNITSRRTDEPVIVARAELDMSRRLGQAETLHNSSNRELLNKQRPGETSNYPTAKYPHYTAVEDRTESFRNWPRARPTTQALCQSGVFYTGNHDLVRCFCCGIGLKDFSENDDPLQEHVRYSRNCAFLLALLGGRGGLERHIRSLPTQDPEEIRRHQRLQYNSQQGRPVTGYRARHERRRTLQSRLDTFTHWPLHLTQRPQELAEAGLYYTGVDDHCRCFACDGGLRKWEPGDDPWIEHCRWFPACPFAIETKGCDFIDLIQLSADHSAEENASRPQEDMTNTLSAMSMVDPLVQRIVDQYDSMVHGIMGFSFEEIKHAVLELVQQGNRAPNVEDIVTQIEVITERNSMRRESHMTQNVEQTEDGIIQENTRLKGMLMCCICGKNQVNILFLPCTHHKVCLDCSRYLDSCPVCKRPIKDKIRTYML